METLNTATMSNRELLDSRQRLELEIANIQYQLDGPVPEYSDPANWRRRAEYAKQCKQAQLNAIDNELQYGEGE